jgi:hypothetical protein
MMIHSGDAWIAGILKVPQRAAGVNVIDVADRYQIDWR